MAKVRIHIAVDLETLNALDTVAWMKRLTRTALIRELIQEELDSYVFSPDLPPNVSTDSVVS
ncbi:MAG: hypothetical protein V3S14_13885 [Anaerolineae bacterium]